VVLRKSISGYTRNRMQNPTIKFLLVSFFRPFQKISCMHYSSPLFVLHALPISTSLNEKSPIIHGIFGMSTLIHNAHWELQWLTHSGDGTIYLIRSHTSCSRGTVTYIATYRIWYVAVFASELQIHFSLSPTETKNQSRIKHTKLEFNHHFCFRQRHSTENRHIESYRAKTKLLKVKSKVIPVHRPCRPIGLWDVKDPTLSTQSAHS
jgi:hypothetical protein